MKKTYTSRRALLASLTVALAGLAAPAFAGWSSPAGLPACPSHFVELAAPEACLLPIANSSFEEGGGQPWVGSLESSHGVPITLSPAATSSGRAAVLAREGETISQMVPLPQPVADSAHEATFVLHVMGHGQDNAAVEIGYGLRIVDQNGMHLGDVSRGKLNLTGSETEYAIRIPSRTVHPNAFLSVELYRPAGATADVAAYIDEVAVSVRDRR